MIVKLSYFSYDKRFLNYNLYFKNTKQFIFYVAGVYFDDSKAESFITGFFVYDKLLKRNMYFGIKHDNGFCSTINNEFPHLFINKNSSCKDVFKIFILDDKLIPTYRSNWLNQEFISHSDIIYKENNILENLAIYGRNECILPKLGKLTLDELFILTEFGVSEDCEKAINATVYPDYIKQPLWSSCNGAYK